jgi:hypothetical protein
MKIKTFETTDSEEMDSLVNDFEDNNNVKATHTHHIWDGSKVWHYATVFYIPDIEELPEPKEVSYTIEKGN